MYTGDFIDLDYEPVDSDVVMLYYLEPTPPYSFEKVVEAMTGESSIGTWTDISTENPAQAEKLRPHIYRLEKQRGLVEVAYPIELFEPANLCGTLASVAGNIYGMKAAANLRILDMRIPPQMLKKFQGPAFGIEGVRWITGVKERPLVGTIIKPKVGLPTKEHAHVAYESWVGGCDIVKDDENLTSQKFNPFKDRVVQTLAARDKAEGETGETKIYMPNITAEVNEMLERGDFVKEQGGRYLMVDVVVLGFSVLPTMRAKDYGLVLHAHRAMHAALTRNKQHGITMLALAKLYRMLGMDQLHIGTAVGKMEGGKEEVRAIYDSITQDSIARDDEKNILPQEWKGMKPTMPVSSGGLYAGHIPELVDFLGKDLIIQAGGGVHGHPDGTIAGATSLRQAVDAVMEGVTLEEKAKTAKELGKVLEKFKG